MYADPYSQVMNNLGNIIKTEPDTRTGVPVASVYGPLEIFTRRVDDWSELTNKMPCITIDLAALSWHYEYDDIIVWRVFPVAVMVYIPLLTRNKDDADAQAEEERADADIRSVYAGLESVFANARTTYGAAYMVELQPGGGIEAESIDWDEQQGLRMRAGLIYLAVRQQIR